MSKNPKEITPRLLLYFLRLFRPFFLRRNVYYDTLVWLTSTKFYRTINRLILGFSSDKKTIDPNRKVILIDN